ncbi:hypothetical protein BKA64DRAFT_720072 [Cadophora sp. MPI-SDFR-AT-0126]|nr:hypothetical protein BKA64DRAFT_720072 [Leotiomycetes sp. MPI-SDFR-AT-0126]
MASSHSPAVSHIEESYSASADYDDTMAWSISNTDSAVLQPEISPSAPAPIWRIIRMTPRPSIISEMMACCLHPTQGHLTLARRDKSRRISTKAISLEERQVMGLWTPCDLLHARQLPGLAPFVHGKIASIVDVIPTTRKVTPPPTANVPKKTAAGLRQRAKAKRIDMFGATTRSGPKRAGILLKVSCAMSVIKHSLARTSCCAIRGKFMQRRRG